MLVLADVTLPLVSYCALLLCDFICVNICWPHVIGHIQLHITTNSKTLLQENTFENKPKKENNNKKKNFWQEVKDKQWQTQEVVNQSCSKASENPSGVWYACVCTCLDTSVSWKQNLPILMCIHSKKRGLRGNMCIYFGRKFFGRCDSRGSKHNLFFFLLLLFLRFMTSTQMGKKNLHWLISMNYKSSLSLKTAQNAR